MCIYIYIFSIDNYIQVMKHRIYSFPLRAEEKQIHTVHRGSTIKRPARQEPRPLVGEGVGQQQKSPQSHCCLLWGGGQVTMRGVGAKPALPGLGVGAPWLGRVGGHIWEPHFSRSLSNLGFTKEKPANAVWSMESMRFLSL